MTDYPSLWDTAQYWHEEINKLTQENAALKKRVGELEKGLLPSSCCDCRYCLDPSDHIAGCDHPISYILLARAEKAEADLEIKILENAKGAQVLMNVEADLAHAVIEVGAIKGLYVKQCEETQKVRNDLARLKNRMEQDYANVHRDMSNYLGRTFKSHATDAVVILLDHISTLNKNLARLKEAVERQLEDISYPYDADLHAVMDSLNLNPKEEEGSLSKEEKTYADDWGMD